MNCPHCEEPCDDSMDARGTKVQGEENMITVCLACGAILIEGSGEDEIREVTASEWLAMTEDMRRAVLDVLEMVVAGTAGKVS